MYSQFPGPPPTTERYQPLRYQIHRPSLQRSPAALISALLIIVAMSGGAWYASRNLLKRAQPAIHATVSPTMPMSEMEDLVRHVDTALLHSTEASRELRRSQDWVDRVVPSLEQQYMGIEKRRLQTAHAASDAAHRDVELAREELEIVKNLLIERTNSKP